MCNSSIANHSSPASRGPSGSEGVQHRREGPLLVELLRQRQWRELRRVHQLTVRIRPQQQTHKLDVAGPDRSVQGVGEARRAASAGLLLLVHARETVRRQEEVHLLQLLGLLLLSLRLLLPLLLRLLLQAPLLRLLGQALLLRLLSGEALPLRLLLLSPLLLSLEAALALELRFLLLGLELQAVLLANGVLAQGVHRGADGDPHRVRLLVATALAGAASSAEAVSSAEHGEEEAATRATRGTFR
mmetsp:Transcript_95470/g.279191  ORF Transcript_95470/g.279191 Transcript_95470/m.279191 type:complete len:244 (+) Transcript_95470:479-1210(+)